MIGLFMTRNHRIRAFLFGLLVVSLAVPAFAGPVKGRPGLQQNREGVEVSLPQASVTIEKKMLEAVVTTTGESYALSSETIIMGMDGKQVSIREMLVPCDAEITFFTEGGKRQAKRIHVKRVSSKNTWQWTTRQPE